MKKKKKIGAYDRLQVSDHSLGGYSRRESRFKNSMISSIALAKSKIEEIEV
jgi:hypothetical protein